MSTDPFTNVDGTINPLQVSGSVDEYSVKVTTRQLRSTADNINVYAGTFFGDITARAIGLQAIIMTALETAIQQIYVAEYNIGDLPSLGKPTTYVFQADDILVSFSGRNDYFIFNGTGANREARFISLGQSDEIYQPGAGGAPATYVFNSTGSQLDYTVSYPATGDFTITDNRGRVVNFDNTGGPVTATYEGNVLDEDSSHADGTITYRNNPYTEIGITVLPGSGTFPSDPNDIITAEGVSGFFYSESITPNYQTLVDYVLGQYSFTPYQENKIISLCRILFNPAKNAVSHVVNVPNLNAFSTGNAFASYAGVKNISFEIRVS